jgi:glycosyltransferase involved in cell wall biosynthesis
MEVMYCMQPDPVQQGAGFGVPFAWDTPMLEGYRCRWLRNTSRNPGVVRSSGCDTPELYDEIRRGQWDAVIVNGWVVKSCLQALVACRRSGIPCIVRGESNDLRPRPLHKRLLHRLLLKQYAAFLYIGEANRRFYLKNGVPPSRLFFGPYCVDNGFFAGRAAAVDRAALRQGWGIPADAVCFLFSGKLESKKRPMDLLEAMGRLAVAPGAGKDRCLLVVGDGELRSECETAAKRLNISARFVGFLNQSRMPDAYAAADCLVLPSDNGETWGLVVNEAMACGLPAIVSDQVGCGEDLIRDGETGYVFRCGDAGDLADKLRRMCGAIGGGHSFAAAVRERVAHYSTEVLTENTVEAVNYVADRGGRRMNA